VGGARTPGRIVVLNGAPRSGKSSIAAAVQHHDRSVIEDCARRLAGLPALFVGVRCPLAVVMKRRGLSGPVPAPVLRWQEQVHAHWTYDLEVDTSELRPEECAEAIRRRLESPDEPSAFARLAREA
jgi:chloramphenicol 3-O phosphotransferase